MFSTRRNFLRVGSLTTLALVAGCTSSAQSGGDDPTDDPTDEAPMDDGGDLPADGTADTSDPVDETRPAGTGGPGVSLTGVDDAPDLPVAPTVEITKGVATEEHPPQLCVTVTNESDETVHVGEGRAVVFAYVTSESDELVLLPTGSDYPAEPGCWRLAEPIAVTAEYRILTLEPGESVTQRLALYGAAGGDGCLPVGEHRFETTYNVTRGTNGTSSDGEQARWGFAVSLE